MYDSRPFTLHTGKREKPILMKKLAQESQGSDVRLDSIVECKKALDTFFMLPIEHKTCGLHMCRWRATVCMVFRLKILELGNCLSGITDGSSKNFFTSSSCFHLGMCYRKGENATNS